MTQKEKALRKAHNNNNKPRRNKKLKISLNQTEQKTLQHA
jgi:hypothetical protein